MNRAHIAIIAAGVAVLVCLGAFKVALAGSAATPAAAEVGACQAKLATAAHYGPVRSLSGAFTVTAGQLVKWQESRDGLNGPHPISPFRAVLSTQTLYV